jgi:hypothetical protein
MEDSNEDGTGSRRIEGNLPDYQASRDQSGRREREAKSNGSETGAMTLSALLWLSTSLVPHRIFFFRDQVIFHRLPGVGTGEGPLPADGFPGLAGLAGRSTKGLAALGP